MILNNNLGKTFGPQLSFSGWILLIFGIFFITDVMGMLLVVLGFFLGSMTDGVLIDVGQRRIKKYSSPFGLNLTGRWEEIQEHSGLVVIPFRKEYAVLSRSNLRNATVTSDYRIFLTGPNHKPRFPVKACPTKEDAITEADKLSGLLHIPIMKIA